MTTKELTKRALKVCKGLNLSYMMDGESYAPGGDVPFDEDPQRFMVFNQTDGGDDGWVDFYPTPMAVARAVAQFVEDEWGLTAIYDLEADDYETVRLADVTVTFMDAVYPTPIGAAVEPTTHGKKTTT